MKLGLICRCKDEYFIEEFVHYYIKEGVDCIYIIDDDSNDKSIYNNLLENDKVNILFEKNIIPTKFSNKLYKSIKDDYDWMIYVDADEFITTKKNSTKTIREELLTTFKDSHCVKVPWVMMSCNSLEKSPKSILKTNTYRWNHDLRHENKLSTRPKFRCRYDAIEVKSIFRPAFFEDLKCHHPINPIKSIKIAVSDGIRNKPSRLSHLYFNLREEEIRIGYLLCYHYRIISIENCINKLKTNKWYIDDGYNLQDLMSTDHPEIIDLTLHDKTKDYLKPKAKNLK
ncbi:glycosyltransferase family 2 protein [Flavivirga aquimarina]|uniref:Glycosyltransferase family 2 protein n=1 Tax=Flavivirga aquimarina TaxID=2027862 RepID=A0ABT8W9J2_9FLAO|nr:glycosyltransferase family 2 protein [Flavivirga aquimarina]MDO5969801.1 glycosyltransferase family 2 protein [Flavivirga aquimarina]